MMSTSGVDLSVVSAASDSGHRVALVGEGRSYTFGALSETVRRVISWLERRGISSARDQRVVVVAWPDVETLIVLYALIERGIAFVPSHPRLTPRELKQQVLDCDPALIIEDAKAQFGEMLRQPPAPAGPKPAGKQCLALVFTAGTTGRSKGAILSRNAFVASARASAGNLGWRKDDRWLLCMPTAHVGGLSIVTRCLLARRTVVLATSADRSGRFDAAAVRDDIERERVTLLSLVPTMLQRLLHSSDTLYTPSRLRAILLGGGPASAKLIAETAARRVPVLTTYGLTETCSQVTVQRYGTRPSEEIGSGEPLRGVDVRVVDEQIQVRGPTLFHGYFPESPESPFLRGGWFATGDLGRLDDRGRLHVFGRRSDLIVTGGENVYPAEVERYLESIPGVRAAAVFGVPDEVWGEIACAAIVRESAPALTVDDLAARIAADVSPHRRPRRIAFLSELPTTPLGKLDRRRLPALAEPHLVAIHGRANLSA